MGQASHLNFRWRTPFEFYEPLPSIVTPTHFLGDREARGGLVGGRGFIGAAKSNDEISHLMRRFTSAMPCVFRLAIKESEQKSKGDEKAPARCSREARKRLIATRVR